MWISPPRVETRNAVQFYALSLAFFELMGAAILTGDATAAILAMLNGSARAFRASIAGRTRKPVGVRAIPIQVQGRFGTVYGKGEPA